MWMDITTGMFVLCAILLILLAKVIRAWWIAEIGGRVLCKHMQEKGYAMPTREDSEGLYWECVNELIAELGWRKKAPRRK